MNTDQVSSQRLTSDLPAIGATVRARTDRVARILGARLASVIRVDSAIGPVYDSMGSLIEYREKVYAIVLKSKRLITYWGPKSFWDYFAPAKERAHKTRWQGSLFGSVSERVAGVESERGVAKESKFQKVR